MLPLLDTNQNPPHPHPHKHTHTQIPLSDTKHNTSNNTVVPIHTAAAEVRLHSFLTSIVDICQPHASVAFTPANEYPIHNVSELNVIILAAVYKFRPIINIFIIIFVGGINISFIYNPPPLKLRYKH
jgi:hypothetical protein